MDTGAIRPYPTIVHDPPSRRDEVVQATVATDLPTEKTVRAAQTAREVTSVDNRRREIAAAHDTAVKTGFERDPTSGSIVYRWTDETTDRVILQLPRSDKILSSRAYQETAAGNSGSVTDPNVDRSV